MSRTCCNTSSPPRFPKIAVPCQGEHRNGPGEKGPDALAEAPPRAVRDEIRGQNCHPFCPSEEHNRNIPDTSNPALLRPIRLSPRNALPRREEAVRTDAYLNGLLVRVWRCRVQRDGRRRRRAAGHTDADQHRGDEGDQGPHQGDDPVLLVQLALTLQRYDSRACETALQITAAPPDRMLAQRLDSPPTGASFSAAWGRSSWSRSRRADARAWSREGRTPAGR